MVVVAGSLRRYKGSPRVPFYQRSGLLIIGGGDKEGLISGLPCPILRGGLVRRPDLPCTPKKQIITQSATAQSTIGNNSSSGSSGSGQSSRQQQVPCESPGPPSFDLPSGALTVFGMDASSRVLSVSQAPTAQRDIQTTASNPFPSYPRITRTILSATAAAAAGLELPLRTRWCLIIGRRTAAP